jgi:uncharacterized protein (DUF736 family)|tara:strand:- start:575 stop:802 length:228 start_codon:yes stop_codon:yes gene_type:complete
MFENKENYGALFKNDQKSKDNQPDYTGKVNVEGADYKIAGWIKESKAGNTYLSLKVSDVTTDFEKKDLPKKDLPF